MTINEFKAWLEGYSASFTNGVPNAEQWAEISARIARLEPARPGTPYAPNFYPNWVVGAPSVTCRTQVVDAVSGQSLGPAD